MRIIAFEPAPENFRMLEKNAESSGAAQIRAYQRAVAASSGSLPFYLKREPGWHSFSADGALAAMSVETVALENILVELSPDPIDFMEMDCEDAEYEFLCGQEEHLARKVHYIAMEYHEVGTHRVNELIETLTCAGFAYDVHPEPRWHTGILYARNLNYGLSN